MTKTKSTKRALLMSGLVLLVCVTMLIGSTFAWFTDNVTSGNNKIIAGNLDIQLLMDTGDGYEDISNSTESIFNMLSNKAQNDNAYTLWEPGKTQVAYLQIKNAGTLALKYSVALKITEVEKNLHEVMQYSITPDATYGTVKAWDAEAGKAVALGNQNVTEADVVMNPGDEHCFALSVHMLETAGNEYQGGMLNFDLTVLAGQATVESDSFGVDYDEYAEYAYKASVAVDKSGNTPMYELVAKDENPQQYNLGYARVPAEAVADNADSLSLRIVPTVYNGNFTVGANETVKSYDVTVTGLKDGKTVEVALKAPIGLDPNTVKLYHKDSLIASEYTPTTGYVKFNTDSFSPFTIVYDAKSEYEAPSVEGLTVPKATVTYAPEYVGEGKVQWGSYGQWSPTAGLEDDLEAAFIFKCPDDLSDEVREAFEYWYCDFYVSLDKDLAENQIFLGGYYESFDAYVGFHNGDVTLKAGEEIPLLGSVVTNAWTYKDIESEVGTFMCGVGDVNDALEGATFTVKLRLTNPENEAQYYDVNVVTYTFGGNYVIK